jgi:hypothetical protein
MNIKQGLILTAALMALAGCPALLEEPGEGAERSGSGGKGNIMIHIGGAFEAARTLDGLVGEREPA